MSQICLWREKSSCACTEQPCSGKASSMVEGGTLLNQKMERDEEKDGWPASQEFAVIWSFSWNYKLCDLRSRSKGLLIRENIIRIVMHVRRQYSIEVRGRAGFGAVILLKGDQDTTCPVRSKGCTGSHSCLRREVGDKEVFFQDDTRSWSILRTLTLVVSVKTEEGRSQRLKEWSCRSLAYQ